MQPETIVDQFRRLSTADQIRLLHELWEEISKDPDAVALTDAQRAILDQRVDTLEQGKTELHDWPEARDRITDDL